MQRARPRAPSRPPAACLKRAACMEAGLHGSASVLWHTWRVVAGSACIPVPLAARYCGGPAIAMNAMPLLVGLGSAHVHASRQASEASGAHVVLCNHSTREGPRYVCDCVSVCGEGGHGCACVHACAGANGHVHACVRVRVCDGGGGCTCVCTLHVCGLAGQK